MKRVFLVVLDSCGAGAAPDCLKFGDHDVNTIQSCYNTGILNIPHLLDCGLGNVEGLDFLGKNESPSAACGRMQEASMGKDTTIGHWEIAGLVSPDPLPTYPKGFPQEVLDAFSEATGRGVLCNLPYSGTEVIKDYGKEQLETGKWIVYTSADSVFQIAAHEELIPLEELYEACRKARKILQGKHGVGRVIARPYVGTPEEGFTRTPNRHDFSLLPPSATLLDTLKARGMDSIAVGKIADIFAHQGTTEEIITHGNTDGLQKTLECQEKDFTGLCFVNLVDFDMLYGHRRDPIGYAKALNEFDQWLPKFVSRMQEDDVLMLTADHGCDPCFQETTDHTREYVPIVAIGPKVKPADLGTRKTFSDVAATVSELLGIAYETPGHSFAKDIL